MSDLLDHLHQLTGHRFRDPKLALQAFTHTSYANEAPGTPHNERLEFLGDAVVGLAAARLLYDEDPAAPEGKLTQHRQRLVSQAGLAIVCDHLGLAPFLRLGGSVREKARLAGGVEESIRGSLVEALIGALLQELPTDDVLGITQGWLRATRDRVIREADTKPAKNRLQELLARRPGNPLPTYRIVERTGPDHDPWHKVAVVIDGGVVATGEGSKRKEAEEHAASLALAILLRAERG